MLWKKIILLGANYREAKLDQNGLTRSVDIISETNAIIVRNPRPLLKISWTLSLI